MLIFGDRQRLKPRKMKPNVGDGACVADHKGANFFGSAQ